MARRTLLTTNCMTEEQQRIAIAEACGWTDCEYIKSLGLCKGKHKEVRPQYDSGHSALPDYLNDLNAMHEAEKVLINDQDLKYSESLALVVKARWKTNNSYDMQKFRSATAAQRSEAFLKTIGKWEKTK